MPFEVISPGTVRELLKVTRQLDGKNFRFGAGCTDLVNELQKEPGEGLSVINLGWIKDKRLTEIKNEISGIRIGARVTANNILLYETVRKRFPVLWEAANVLASPQIRQVATVGGNICTASPAGDIACALLALNSDCEMISPEKKTRTLPIEQFFVNVRKTVLQKGEILYSIHIPRNDATSVRFHSGFIKVGTRRSMECAVVSLAYHFQVDRGDKIIRAGIAIGSAAPVIKFARSACELITGKKISSFTDADRNEFAQRVVSYAQPISDIRGSAWYRKEVLFNISKSILEGK
ncbi:MAG: FAD binding domain-containing protein [Bacteroidetes bacterium]|nr:FAD binding domain-containing protein [Bacteroidota bacterium]